MQPPKRACEVGSHRIIRDQLQILFGVASRQMIRCVPLVRKLLKEFPAIEAQLIVCGPLAGTNLKVSKLMQLEPLAKYDVLVISDADVRVPADFLVNVLVPLARCSKLDW